MRLRPPAAAVTLALMIAIAGCGGDDETTTIAAESTIAAGATGASGAVGAVADCLGDFNSRADDNLARIARLAHEPGDEILVGTYAGEEFEAETYDVDPAEGDGTEATVAPGDCVVSEVSAEFGTLYVFAVGDDGDWHNFLPTDSAVAVADDPASQLENLTPAELSDDAPPRVPKLVPAS